jgi:hypothetical protein
MAVQGYNKGFHMLDEFVCDAIHAPSVPLANPGNQGRNEGMSVVEELLFEAGKAPPLEDPNGRQSPGTAAAEDAIKLEAQRLAAMIAAAADPIGTVTRFQKLLLAELTSIQKTAPAALEKGRGADHRSESGGE